MMQTKGTMLLRSKFFKITRTSTLPNYFVPPSSSFFLSFHRLPLKKAVPLKRERRRKEQACFFFAFFTHTCKHSIHYKFKEEEEEDIDRLIDR